MIFVQETCHRRRSTALGKSHDGDLLRTTRMGKRQFIIDTDKLVRLSGMAVHLDLAAVTSIRRQRSTFVKSRRAEPTVEPHRVTTFHFFSHAVTLQTPLIPLSRHDHNLHQSRSDRGPHTKRLPSRTLLLSSDSLALNQSQQPAQPFSQRQRLLPH